MPQIPIVPPEQMQKVVDGIAKTINPPDPLQRSRTTRTLTAKKWRGCPGLQLKDRHGDRYIVADHPHQRGLDGSQVAAWLDDGRDRSAPAIVYAEDIAEVL